MQRNTPQPKRSAMIGVVHLDPQGEERLRRMLDIFRPDLITLEVSEYALAFRRKHGPRLRDELLASTSSKKRQHGQLTAVLAKLKMPFEYTVAEHYCRENGAAVHCLDDSALSRKYLADFAAETFTQANLAHLANLPDVSLSRQAQRFYERVRRLARDEPVPAALIGSTHRLKTAERRDVLIKQRAENLLRQNCPARWLHVGGAEHLLRVRGYSLFWNRFAAWSMERYLLDRPEEEFGRSKTR